MYRSEGEIKNIIRKHICVEKYEFKRNIKGMKGQRNSKPTTQNVMQNDFLNTHTKKKVSPKNITGIVQNCGHWQVCMHDTDLTWIGGHIKKSGPFNPFK